MARFNINLEIEGWDYTAQELADVIMIAFRRCIKAPVSFVKIEVQQYGKAVKLGETYYRR